MFLVAAIACSARAETPTAIAIYDGPARLAPFPSDHFLRGGRVSLGEVGRTNPFVRAYAATLPELEQRDGFSTIGAAFFQFSEELEDLSARAPSDFAAPGTSLALVDVAAGRAVPVVVRTTSSNDDGRAVDPDFALFVDPAVPLEPKTRYVLVVSDGLRTKSGAGVGASAATRALVAGDAEGDYGVALRAALPVVERASGIGVDRIVAATMFTTGSVHDELATIAKDVRESPPPTTSTPTVEKTEGSIVRFAGTFPAPERRGADGKWHGLDVRGTAQLEYFLAFTNRTRSGPRPVIVFGHGLGGDKDMITEAAQYLADLDVALVAIDAPEHGSRHDPPFPPGGTDQVSSTLGFIGVDLDAKSIDVGIARDNFRQLASDQLHLFRLVSGLGALDLLPAGAPDGVPDLDPSRVFYLGVSFGAVVGSTALAFVPEAHAACLTVGGAPLGTIMRDSQTLRLLVNSILPEGATDADLSRFIAVAQGIIDSGDPVNYAPFVAGRPFPGVPGWRGTDILLQEAIDDGIIPNSASSMLARALGLVQVEPALVPVPGLSRAPSPLAAAADAPVRGLLQLDRADGQPTNHRTFFGTAEARRQYVDFFRSALAAPRPTIK